MKFEKLLSYSKQKKILFVNCLIAAVLLEQNVMWSESVDVLRRGLEKLTEQRPLVTIRFDCAAWAQELNKLVIASKGDGRAGPIQFSTCCTKNIASVSEPTEMGSSSKLRTSLNT